MAWLLADEAQPVEGSSAAIFFSDTSTVLAVLGVASALVSAAIALGFEGLGRPLWLLIVIAALALAAVLLVRKWRAEVSADAQRCRRVTPAGAPESRLVSTAWERGVVVAGVAGLLTYIMTADHGFGHPPHWIVAGVGVLVGYALAVAATTPHFRLAAPATR